MLPLTTAWPPAPGVTQWSGAQDTQDTQDTANRQSVKLNGLFNLKSTQGGHQHSGKCKYSICFAGLDPGSDDG